MSTGMTAQRWQRINELFHAAVALDTASRTRLLDRDCAGDAQLRCEVEDLIAGHKSAEAGFETEFVRQAVHRIADEVPDTQVQHEFGPYRVVREIGRGGMGRVFLAERADQEYHKRVAIKLIKRGMDTDAVVRHFRNEREILASLDHPNIARLLDGGTSLDGLPYFVMEYIEGQPIDTFCDQHEYSIHQRLQLFRKACDAISYAHQHLVVHRDIKPSNILVTEDGAPKLLDFGIARLLRAEGESDTAATVTGLRLMTPEYASPEQILGQPASTHTDVYSLGVVLYKLLAGVNPYTFASRSQHDIAETICRNEPKRPSLAAAESRAAAASSRRDAPSKTSREPIDKRLQGDLDNIVLMAMRKEPQRRYQSAEQFSEDIRRHLDSLPVLAREDTLGYRLTKFAGRHRPAVTAGGIAVLALLAGIVATTVQAHRASVEEELAKQEQAKAERRFNEVRKLARTVLFDYHDAIKNLPGSTPIRQRLVSDALQYLDSLAREAAGDRSLLRELASAYERVADVQGGTMEANLGNTTGAIESGKKALQLRATLSAAEPANPDLRRELASSYAKVGLLLWETGDMSGAAEHFRSALRLREELVKGDVANIGLRNELANSVDRLGMLQLEQGDAQGALANFRRTLNLYTSVPEAEQHQENMRRAISVAYEHIGSALLQLEDLTGALENNTRALQIRTALAHDFPLNADHQRTLLVSYYNQGEILAGLGRIHEALDNYRKDVAIGEKRLRADPDNEQPRGDLAYGLVRVGDMRFKLGEYVAALDNYRHSQNLRARDVKSDATNLWKRASLIEAKAKICKTLAAQQSEEVEQPCSEVLAMMQATVLDAGNEAIRSFFADTYTDLAQAQTFLARSAAPDERRERLMTARGLYSRSLDIWRDLKRRNILSQADHDKESIAGQQIAACDRALR